MLAKELAEMLLNNPDEEVIFRFQEQGAEFEYFTIQRIAYAHLTTAGYPLKMCFDLERDAPFAEWEKMDDSEKVKKIEKALGFTLFPWQIDFIMERDAQIPTGRRSGRTTAFILRLLLRDETPLRAGDIVTDGEQYGQQYKQIFMWEMKKIRGQLIKGGIPVRQIIDRRGNTWRQDGAY